MTIYPKGQAPAKVTMNPFEQNAAESSFLHSNAYTSQWTTCRIKHACKTNRSFLQVSCNINSEILKPWFKIGRIALSDLVPYLQAVINDVTQKKAKLLHLLAKAENIRTSRDELTDMLAANSLPENLQSIWDTKGAEQLGIVRLNKAASRGEVEELQVRATSAYSNF